MCNYYIIIYYILFFILLFFILFSKSKAITLLFFLKIISLISSFLGFSLISCFFLLPVILFLFSLLELLELAWIVDDFLFFIKSLILKTKKFLFISKDATPINLEPVSTVKNNSIVDSTIVKNDGPLNSEKNQTNASIDGAKYWKSSLKLREEVSKATKDSFVRYNVHVSTLKEIKQEIDFSFKKQKSFIKSLPVSKTERSFLLKDLQKDYINHLKLVISQFNNSEREREIPKVFQKTERLKFFWFEKKVQKVCEISSDLKSEQAQLLNKIELADRKLANLADFSPEADKIKDEQIANWKALIKNKDRQFDIQESKLILKTENQGLYKKLKEKFKNFGIFVLIPIRKRKLEWSIENIFLLLTLITFSLFLYKFFNDGEAIGASLIPLIEEFFKNK